MTADLSNPSAQLADLRDRLRILQNVKQADNHAGTGGADTVHVGALGDSYSPGGTSYGSDSWAGDEATAIGYRATANWDRSTALGHNSVTSATDQMMLGTSSDRVVVPGRFNLSSPVPSSTSDTQGIRLDIAVDDSFIYVKTSFGWKRVALSTF